MHIAVRPLCRWSGKTKKVEVWMKKSFSSHWNSKGVFMADVQFVEYFSWNLERGLWSYLPFAFKLTNIQLSCRTNSQVTLANVMFRDTNSSRHWNISFQGRNQKPREEKPSNFESIRHRASGKMGTTRRGAMSFFFMYELMLATVISMEIFPFCFPLFSHREWKAFCVHIFYI